jgi:Uma2 family endonuclease
VECGARLLRYLDRNPVGHAYIKLHCKLRIGGQPRYRLPDVSVILGPFVEGHSEGAPDLCVEIRSPEDSLSDQIGKFEDYFANGCKLGWLILPEEGTVLVLKPGAAPRVARAGDYLDGAEVLPGLRIPVAELFG